MPSNLQRLGATLEQGFPIGEDIPTALADPERVERLRRLIGEIAADDLVVEMVGDASFRRTRHGTDGFVEAWRDWVDPFESFRTELDEFLEAGPHVVVLVRLVARPRGGGTEITSEAAALWCFEGDRLVRVEFHLDRATALRAAGLTRDSS
jgi:ketosteroid isomerase-like protein